MNNDYSFSILAEQRRQDFAAEAANDRLARTRHRRPYVVVAPAWAAPCCPSPTPRP